MSQERVDETAKGEHEPVAWILGRPAYYAPPKCQWIGMDGMLFAEDILREKNSG